MTRINVGIKPQELTNKLLIAEHREITRIPNAIFSGKAKFSKIPDKFKLGAGHVKFFYNKVLYLFKRYIALYEECVKRGFQVTDKSSAFDQEKFCQDVWMDYDELPEDRLIIIQRIESKGMRLLEIQSGENQ